MNVHHWIQTRITQQRIIYLLYLTRITVSKIVNYSFVEIFCNLDVKPSWGNMNPYYCIKTQITQQNRTPTFALHRIRSMVNQAFNLIELLKNYLWNRLLLLTRKSSYWHLIWKFSKILKHKYFSFHIDFRIKINDCEVIFVSLLCLKV